MLFQNCLLIQLLKMINSILKASKSWGFVVAIGVPKYEEYNKTDFWRQILFSYILDEFFLFVCFVFHWHNRDLTCGWLPGTDTLKEITVLGRMVGRSLGYPRLFSERGEHTLSAKIFLMHINVLWRNVKKSSSLHTRRLKH